MLEAAYWLGFSLVPELGPRRIRLLWKHFEQLSEAWTAPDHQLRQAGLDGKALANLLSVRQKIDLEHELMRIERVGAHIFCIEDNEYPTLLKPLEDAPPVLYLKGQLSAHDANALAVVGTRKATNYGRSATHQLCKHLAAHGITIISGLAQGIDAAAHQGALEAGRTIAVLGCGIDRVYPNEHYELAARIAHQGALVSEFPLGTPPISRNFPRRNRIISGLARGVMVVEAPENSGAIITATTAADQGRDVFAVPGSIFSIASTGTHRLIQEGATLVRRAQDVLEALEMADVQPRSTVMPARPAPSMPPPPPPQDSHGVLSGETDVELVLMQTLSSQPIHIDDLVRETGLPIAVVASALTMLELKGLAQNLGHMQYCLNAG